MGWFLPPPPPPPQGQMPSVGGVCLLNGIAQLLMGVAVR